MKRLFKEPNYAYKRVEHRYARDGSRKTIDVPAGKVLPYGAYVEGDGSLVYYDRDYKPLFRVRRKGGKREYLPPDTWIKVVNQIWFYSEHIRPQSCKKMREHLLVMKTNHMGVE